MLCAITSQLKRYIDLFLTRKKRNVEEIKTQHHIQKKQTQTIVSQKHTQQISDVNGERERKNEEKKRDV